MGSQEDVAARADVSQSLISQIERGVQHPLGVSVERFGRLLAALEWSSSEFSRETGIDLSVDILLKKEGDKTYEVIQVKRSAPLPPGLEAAIKIYGKRFEDLQDPVWQQYLAGFNWRSGQPQNPEAWLDLYRDLVRAGVEPGEA